MESFSRLNKRMILAHFVVLQRDEKNAMQEFEFFPLGRKFTGQRSRVITESDMRLAYGKLASLKNQTH